MGSGGVMADVGETRRDFGELVMYQSQFFCKGLDEKYARDKNKASVLFQYFDQRLSCAVCVQKVVVLDILS